MQTITKQDILKGLPDRWLRQYPLNHYNASSKYEGDLEKFAKGKRLKKLRDEGLLTIELANKTIGNDSWTTNECSQCGKDKDFVVSLKSVEEYCTICPDCFKELEKLMSKQPK